VSGVERLIDLAAPTSRVWAILTDPEEFARLYAHGGAEFSPTAGSPVRLDWPGRGTFLGEVEETEHPHRFCYRLAAQPDTAPTPANSTLVEFTLTPTPAGCRLVVRETGFDKLGRAAEDEAKRLADDAWTTCLRMLAETLT
jgi:uncharacterized protein YndB with AHSA1/START domain